MNPKKHPFRLKTLPGVEQPSSVNKKLPVSPRHRVTTSQYIEGILSGNRTILSRAITLVESNRGDHRKQAQEIIGECLKNSKYEGRRTKDEVSSPQSAVSSPQSTIIIPTTSTTSATSPHPSPVTRHPSPVTRHDSLSTSFVLRPSSIRIGITGVPGAGKSTFIETLGKYITGLGHRLAVLAVDPSSSISGGSILGDKTRMESLAVDPNAFIRPSPSAGTLGGVARKTRETILLCEAAGFDVIFVETVGVGQSETAVKGMVDFFLLLMITGAGDELQGIKRGIIEMADAVIINKADGDNLVRAEIAAREYGNALRLFPPSQPGWTPVVGTCSALTGEGIPNVWEIVGNFFEAMLRSGQFRRNRAEQNRLVFSQSVEERLREKFFSDPAVKKQIRELEKKVAEGILNPYLAASDLVSRKKMRDP